MCGRTACTLDPSMLCKACAYKNDTQQKYKPAEWKDYTDCTGRGKYRPSPNHAPTMYSPVLLSKKYFDPAADPKERVIQPMLWGMIPPWHRGKPTAHGLTTNNCRIESIMDKKLYGSPLKRGQRCVVLCDGFYEWKAISKNQKQPYFIYFDQPEGISIGEPETFEGEATKYWDEREGWKGPKPLTMAGIFDKWNSPEGGPPIYCYSVVTMDSGPAVSWIHERMPAILETTEEINDWLDFGHLDAKAAIAKLKPASNLKSHPVSTLVGNVRNQDVSLSKPIELKESKPALSASSKFMSSWLAKASPVKKELVAVKTDPESASVKGELDSLHILKREAEVKADEISPTHKKVKLEFSS